MEWMDEDMDKSKTQPVRPIRPIRPSEVVAARKKQIPEQAIQAFNDCIAKHYNGNSTIFRQDEVLDRMVELIQASTHPNSEAKDIKNIVFEEGWLDVEEIFRQEGWDVSYDKPAYNESYPATFTFKAKNTGSRRSDTDTEW